MPSVSSLARRISARRQVMPAPAGDVAVVRDDVADQGERQCEGMRGHFTDAVIGRVRKPHAVFRAGCGVDRVVAGADAADDAEPRQLRERALGDRRILDQKGIEVAACGKHLVFGRALGDDELDAGVAEELALERQVFVVLVGDQDAGHRIFGNAGERRRAPGRKRYVGIDASGQLALAA